MCTLTVISFMVTSFWWRLPTNWRWMLVACGDFKLSYYPVIIRLLRVWKIIGWSSSRRGARPLIDSVANNSLEDRNGRINTDEMRLSAITLSALPYFSHFYYFMFFWWHHSVNSIKLDCTWINVVGTWIMWNGILIMLDCTQIKLDRTWIKFDCAWIKSDCTLIKLDRT